MSKLPIFDPKQVPVFQVDTHLEAVPAQHLTPQALPIHPCGSPNWCVNANSWTEHLPKRRYFLES